MKKYEGTLIFSGRDAIGPVEVVDDAHVRYLHLGTPVQQSSMFLQDPYALEMEYIRKMAEGLRYKPHPSKVLCLGLGGGSLPRYIWKHYPECNIDAVELSPLVIEVSYRYFFLPSDDRLHVFNEDALHFLERPQGDRYAMIFADLYLADGISPVVSQSAFFERCHHHLEDDGILVWNMWRSGDQNAIKRNYNNLHHLFGGRILVLECEESPNYVLLVFKHPNLGLDH